jgi:hypothetical protein
VEQNEAGRPLNVGLWYTYYSNLLFGFQNSRAVVAYRDLARKPVAMLEAICRKLGVQPLSHCLAQRRGDEKTV